MCGINGFMCRQELADSYSRIQRMNQSLIHRGPDAGGAVVLDKAHAALGQRRLSVIDLDVRSNQPMKSNSGRSIFVYNGEIYNYKELKGGLSYSYKTDSDTEVLMSGLEMYGMPWLQKCNGMFAFALYDQTEKTLLLGRDRFGIKPLYYYHDENFFIFSSEIKGILNSGLVKAEFNEYAVDEYLGNRYVREPFTFFKNIYQLPGGCCLQINASLEMRLERYWKLPDQFNLSDAYDEESIYEAFKNQIYCSVNKRMIADVTVGTYLSGGIDSSIISAICAGQAEKPVNTYTIGFPELNEFSYARKVAEEYGTVHHEILMDGRDYFNKLEEIISFKDAPLGVPNEIPLAIMSKELQKRITVVLSGEGADELLGGYGKIFRSPFDYTNIDRNCGLDFYNYFIEKYEYVPRAIRDEYLTVDSPYRQEFDDHIRNSFSDRGNEENVFRFFHEYHVKGLLQRVDTTTMYSSVEARVPFLDHELVEFAYREVPYSLKLRWNSGEMKRMAAGCRAADYSERMDSPKYLLRRLGLELLPKETVTRRKMGFPVPLDQWFPRLEGMAYDVLGSSEWMNTKKLKSLISDCSRNSRSGQLLWMFINIELFRRMYFEKEWRY